MNTRPHQLAVVLLYDPSTKKNQRPEMRCHADNGERALCGRTINTAAGDEVSLVPTGKTGEPRIEQWPKHWPSTDNRPVCAQCVAAAELMWRRVDRAPNVKLMNASDDLRRLAAELTPALAEAREVLESIGYPKTGDGRSSDPSDNTGRDAATATSTAEWIEDVRDARDAVLDDIVQLDRLLAKRRGASTVQITCGDAQRNMTADQHEGWTQDFGCDRYGSGSTKLCDRCGKRYQRRSQEAA